MAASYLYGCLLLLVLGQQPHSGQAAAPTGDSCGSSFLSAPGLGIINPLLNLPAMAISLDSFSVSSAEECRTRCCSEPNCNLAMTQDGDGAKICYLVNCLNNGTNVCELGPAPDMHSYHREVGRKPTLTAIQSANNPLDRYALKQSQVAQSSEELKYEDYCTPKAETGLCRAAFPRWSFDTATSTCKQFIYGGCGGNQNNYESEKECLDKCLVSKPDPQKQQGGRGSSFQEYCAVSKVTGPCRAAFPRWYYDLTSGSCIKFLYGGCKGNKNNYMSKEDCDNQCANRTDEHENYDPLRPFHHSATAVALAVLLAIMIAILLGAMVVVFVKMARRHHRDSSLAAVWSPIDDKECLMNNAYTL